MHSPFSAHGLLDMPILSVHKAEAFGNVLGGNTQISELK